VAIPTLREYYIDLDKVLDISSDGPSKSFAFRRLQYLEGKWNLYILLNEHQEMADSKVSRSLGQGAHIQTVFYHSKPTAESEGAP
jgi:hypothetical protein